MNRIIRKIYKSIGVVLSLSLLFVMAVPVGIVAEEADQEPETIRVGWYEDSYHISGENGDRSGYAYEFEQTVTAYTGWNYEYIKGDWGELLEKLENGEIDMMAALSYTDARAQKMLFSDLPMGDEKYYLYADLNNTDISAADLSTINGKRIIVMEQSVQGTQFAAWEKEHNIQTQHMDVDNFEYALSMISKREIDGVVSTETPAWVEAGMSAVARIGGSSIYYGINKNRPDIKEKLDAAMRAMESDKPFYADELYQRYLSAQSAAVLSTEEKDWITQHGAIRIGCLSNDSGISMMDTVNGEVKGVVNDYIEYAENCLGNQSLDFELYLYDSATALQQALKDGEIDMIFHTTQNPYYAERNDLSLSNTVLSLSLAAVTTQDSFDESAQNVVAVDQNNRELYAYISYNYPTWKIIDCDSYQEAEQMVREGWADCLVAGSGQSINYLNDKRFHSIFLTKPCNIAFATHKGDTVLLSVLNKTLKTMQTSKLSGAVTMYEDSMKKVTLADFIKDNLLAVVVVFFMLFACVLTIVLMFLKKAKTAEAQAKESMVRAETASAAKSTFLFNMSHDIRTPMNALLGYNRLMKKDLTDPKLLDYQEKIEQAGQLLLSIINNVLDMACIENGKVEVDENYARTGDILKEVCDVFEVEAKKKDITFTYEKHIEHEHIVCDAAKIKEIFTNLISNAIKYTASGGTVNVRLREIPCDRVGYVRLKTEVVDNGIGMSKEYLPQLYESFSRERNTTIGGSAGTGLGMPIVKRLVDLLGGTITVESEPGKGSRFTVILEHKLADQAYYEGYAVGYDYEDKEWIRGRSVLLAEDNDMNAEIAEVILEDMGLKVDRVKDGIQCIARLEQMPADTYDLILMDIQMPNMDGYRATQNIRQLSDHKKAAIPIIAMTANAFEEDKKMAFAQGMDGHISKPIDAGKMLEAMMPVLKHGGGTYED